MARKRKKKPIMIESKTMKYDCFIYIIGLMSATYWYLSFTSWIHKLLFVFFFSSYITEPTRLAPLQPTKRPKKCMVSN